MKLRDPALSNKRIYYYCTAADDRFASNAAVLLGAFMIIWEGKTAKEAYAPFAAVRAKFAPYRDASYWPSDFDVTVADTLDGIYKVRRPRRLCRSGALATMHVSSSAHERQREH